MKQVCIIFICSFFSLCFASPNLVKYLENDLELQRLALEVEKAKLSSAQASVNNGLAVKLSTGTVSLIKQGGNFNVSFSPSASVSIPAYSNLKLSASSSVKISGKQNNTDNTKLSLCADIISANALTRKLALMSAKRDLLNAKRSLQNRALEAEKEYYTELKTLFTLENRIIQAQKTLYDNTIKFEEIKAKGYALSSSKHRQAELQVLTDKHNVEEKIRTLEHSCAVFAAKCGTSFEKGQKARDFLPDSIETVEPADITSFEKAMYKKIEEAKWIHQYNSLKRSSGKNFSLAANAGYTINNSSSRQSDTVDVGANAGLYGLNLGAGVSIPIVQSGVPVYMLSASINPNEFKTARIRAEKNSCSEKQELIALQSASDAYDASVIAQQQSLNDINWSKQSNATAYDMYARLENDMAGYLKAGIITESEYLSSCANKEQFRIQLLINDIDLILYTNTVKLLFCRDNELQ